MGFLSGRSPDGRHYGGLSVNRLLLQLWREEDGQNVSEYALLIALVAFAPTVSRKGRAAAIEGLSSTATSNLTRATR
jgi:Flp pilus assembly pilin Flp